MSIEKQFEKLIGALEREKGRKEADIGRMQQEIVDAQNLIRINQREIELANERILDIMGDIKELKAVEL